MTISVCWQRKFREVDEIIFASDSRLSAGYRWDCAQKIFPIEGPNFCISFAGHSDFAFPCIFQFQNMVKNYFKFSSGAAPISVMVKDFLAICNQMLSLVDDRKIAQFNQTLFLLSGYNFVSGQAYQKVIFFNKSTNQYERKSFNGIKYGEHGGTVGFAGDMYDVFFKKLGQMMSKKKTAMNYEPLEVLDEIIKTQTKNSSYGGAIQIVKVYRHRNYLPYAVSHKSTGSEVTLFGRPLLEYEKTFYPIANLDKIGADDFIFYPNGSPVRELNLPEEII